MPRQGLSVAATALLLLLSASARADDHADQAAQGTWISPGTALDGRLDGAGDRDYFRFTALAGARYRLETEGPAGDVDTMVAAFSPAGTQVGEDDDSGPGRLSRLDVTTAAAGTWAARVRHYNAAGTGAYRLRLTLLSAPTPPPPSSVHVLSAPSVFDPRLEGAALVIETRADGAAAWQATLEVRDATGALVRALAQAAPRQGAQTYRDTWDGRDAQGRHLRPGRYALRLTVARGAQREQVERPVHLARLGALTIAFSDPGDSTRVPLHFHRPDASGGGSPFAVDAAGPAWALARSPLGSGCLDAADGRPLPGPPLWTETARPPREASGAVTTRGRSLPVAYALGARPRLSLTLGTQAGVDGGAVPAGWPIAGLPLRVVVGGPAATPGVASGELQAATQAVVDLPAQGGGVGKAQLDLELSFEYREGGVWRPIPGLQRTKHGYYRLLGRNPTGEPTWVGAIDLAARMTGGAPLDRVALLSALVRGVNGQQGLVYDDVTGAAVYTDMAYWFELASYLEGQRHGRVINCTDAGSLVTALGNHCGVEARVVTIGWNFQLHWIRGIGGTQFIHDLFGGWHAFSYHDFASLDRGFTVHDACLSVDGDGQPWSAPFSERLPQGMSLDPYLRALSPDAGLSGGFGSGGGPVIQVQVTNAVRVR